jgi:hypothetical protein
MIKWKDIAHLYLGCECLVETGIETQPIKLTGISYDEGELWCHFENTETGYALVEDVKPILRPLSDMTEEERRVLILERYSVSNTLTKSWIDNNVMYFETTGFTQGGKFYINEYTPDIFLYLLSRHFDLFNLLDTNQAIKKQ